MRRSRIVGMVGLVVLPLVAACDTLREAFSARAEVAASAAGQTLTVTELAQLAGPGRQVPLEEDALARVASVWVDYTLFAQALAGGDSLRDSTMVLHAMWPLASRIKFQRFHERMVARRAALSPQQLDSAYQAGDLRMFQHILFRTPPNAADTLDARKRREAERLLPQARSAGARFAQLARRHSEDPGSSGRGGNLGVMGRGQFVPPFEDAAWELGPGAVSGVVQSQFGYHIIRRPPLAEVRDTFHAQVAERTMASADSLYLDSLSVRRDIDVVGRAPELARWAAENLEEARGSGRALVTYRGGTFRVRDLVRWMEALEPGLVNALPQATDDQIRQFLRAVVQQELLVQQADSAGIGLGAEDVAQLREQHDSVLAILGGVLNLTPEALRDSAATPEARRELAAARVDDYVDRLLQGRARYFPVPAPLAQALRERGGRWAVHAGGLRRALEQARALREAADSAQRAASPPQPPPAAPDTAPRTR